ncbi:MULTISPECIES: anti-sigma factor family protein [Pseudomonas]|uniref:anti-sigma factor family protein n=1 Tax=Pseudomonas TaxID=286 RepID=UPI0003AA9FB2|nr:MULTISPECIES: anti-sigma factor [Pseudomonas]MBH3360961.1 anti-sigma factor [Pseudomonas guariconensis]MCO7624116.1 anti-sigma factor [Pseudomonas guariconensis]MEB3842147.1 anti-sigma factor [Pseudomonas guariconensis]MEB3875015.1 anti-sigma factor [Pseudomonas guariconensis]MEB3880643.1 anti-sigma factor [Pseudomonas guariconensis]
MTPLIPTEHELHAYIDDRLDPVRRAQVHAWLAANPQEAAQVEAWRNDARRLRAALAGFGQATTTTDLDLGQLKRRLRQRRQRQWASAALLLLALGVGGFGGWQAREATLVADILPMADAVQAHRLFAGGTKLDVQAGDPQLLQAWLERHFDRVGQLPDLGAYGFQPVGARLLSNEQGPAALLVFQDNKGERISLFLRSPSERFARMPSGQRTEGQLEARYWSHGAYNFALVGAADDARADRLRQALGVSL